jgi:hypothetical protein
MDSPARPRLGVLCVLLLLGGCAAAPRETGGRAVETSYREKAASWIGKTETQLVRGLGEPSSSITVPGGDTFDEYRDAGCVITFRIDSKRVVASVDWKGADCASSGP